MYDLVGFNSRFNGECLNVLTSTLNCFDILYSTLKGYIIFQRYDRCLITKILLILIFT